MNSQPGRLLFWLITPEDHPASAITSIMRASASIHIASAEFDNHPPVSWIEWKRMMSEMTLAIRNARVVDGTGRPGYVADVGVEGDKIARIGRIADDELNGAHVIDAGGRVLAPGFIDIHTHYDAHLSWDGAAAPSPDHGVTSLVIGNCSVSLAPYAPEHLDMLLGVFQSVEDITPEIISQTVPFTWRTVPEYLDYLRGLGLGPNVGMLVGYTMLRTLAMGDDAGRRAATAPEIDRMAGLMRDAIEAGAMGLSLSYVHKDPDGRWLPNVFAEQDELKAVCRAMGRAGRGMLELAPNFGSYADQVDILDMLGELSADAGIAASLDGITHKGHGDELWRDQIAKLETWQARGARLTAQLLVRPFDQTINLSGTVLSLMKLAHWDDIMMRDSATRIAAMRDNERVEKMIAIADAVMPRHAEAVVLEGRSRKTRELEGRTIGEIAHERGESSPHKVMIDIALGDELDVTFGMSGLINGDTDVMAEILRHPLVHPGAGDAGAHVTQFAGAGDTSYLFEKYVRELGKFSVEEGVHMLTGRIASDWGIAQRGTIAIGQYADLVVFDPDTIARGDAVRVSDYPSNSSRWVRHPKGIGAVVVNGSLLRDEQGYSEARTGSVI